MLAIGAVAAHDSLAALVLRGVAGRMGYDVHESRLRLSTSSLSLAAPIVTARNGEPVFRAQRIDITFSLRDLLPGSRRRFGLRAVDLEQPRLTLIHNADGSYNVALPGANAAKRPDQTPLDMHLRIRDGRITFIDRFVSPGHERRESLVALNADAILAPVDPAYYRVDAQLEDAGRRYPIAGRARFDHARHFASQHWWAAELPIGPLVNFALSTHGANVVDGRLTGFDARGYGFLLPDGTTDTHLGARADLVDGKIFAQQLALPIGDAHGPLILDGNGMTTTGIDATLAGTPLHLAGGVYDFAHPTLRFLLTARGPLTRLKTIARAAAKRPIAGDVALTLHVDGPVSTPFVRGTFASRRFVYDRYVLDGVAGSVAFSGAAFEVAAVRARYGPLALRGSGTLDLGRHVRTNLVVTLDGASDAIPYANALLPGADLHGVVMLDGVDAALGARGSIAARGTHGTLDALFDVDPHGVGTIGPVRLTRSDGASLYARLDVDRPRNSVAGVVAAHRLSLLPARIATLPGLPARALPPLRGSLDADVALNVRSAKLAAAAGALRLRGAAAGGLVLGDASANVGGDGDTVTLPNLRVRGPLADVDAEGAFTDGMLAAQGRLRSTFSRLRPLLRGLAAKGSLDVPLRIVLDGTQRVVQIDRARFWAADVRGVSLHDASATIAQRGDAFDVVAALLGVDGGNVVARGSFGNGGTLAVDASVPLRGGRVVALAQITGTRRAPRGSLAAAVDGAQLAGAPLAGAALAKYDAGRMTIAHSSATYGSATAFIDGTVSGIAPGTASPRVDITARVRGADVGSLARVAHLPLRYPEAAADADVRVTGALRDPAIAGAVRIPIGSLNGLAFRDVVVPVQGRLAALAVHGGRATVGSTTLRFDAAASRERTRVALAAPRANLADFNDYFDAAQTLDGRGSVRASFVTGPATLMTAGRVALRGTRVRRLPIGDVDATWTTRGRTIVARADAGGANGRLSARGSALLPVRDPLRRLAASTLDVDARLVGLELGAWLPAFGITAPVTGRVDGTAQVRGTAPRVAVSGAGALTNGMAGRVPIRSLTVAARADQGRARIARAELHVLNATATGSGWFGLGARDPLALSVHAASPDVGAFASQVTGKPFDAAGAFDGTVRVTGTRVEPAVAAVLALDRPRYGTFVANRARLDAAFANRRLTLHDASLNFADGSLALSGSVPATMRPPFIDRRNAPIAAHALAQHVDLARLATLFPKGTQLGGIIEGNVAVTGTTGDPALGGGLTLTHGSYVSPLLASELRDATIDLAFAGHRAVLRTLHADLGGGAIDGTGDASVGDLRALGRTLAFRVSTRERHVGLDVAKLFRAKVDGTLAVSRAASQPVLVAGDLAFAHTRIPLAALLPRPPPASSAAPLPIAFNLAVAATTDDRVQGPNVDVGAIGRAVLGGTLAQPTLAGAFTSTDGTLSFYRSFVLQNARVAFHRADGIIPTVDATATTHIPDPSTDVLLRVHGRATELALDLASRPDYDRAQILGLLVNAQALGAVSGVAQTTPSTSGPNPLAGAAVGFVNQEFTRTLFEPFSSSLGAGLGLSTLAFAPSLTGGFTASASRRIGEHLTASFSDEQLPSGQRQSFAIAGNFSDATSVQLSLFGAGTAGRTIGTASPLAPSEPGNLQLDALAPPPGTNGFVFSFVKRFWVGGPPVPSAQQVRREPVPAAR